MASKIVPGDIDATYPKAGQDNTSQGFRDNFAGIKNNFTEAVTEIEALQTNKASLNGSSDFADNEVLRAKFKDTSESIYAHGTDGGAISLNPLSCLGGLGNGKELLVIGVVMIGGGTIPLPLGAGVNFAIGAGALLTITGFTGAGGGVNGGGGGDGNGFT